MRHHPPEIGEPADLLCSVIEHLIAARRHLDRAADSAWTTPAAALAASDAEICIAKARLIASELCSVVAKMQRRQRRPVIRHRDPISGKFQRRTSSEATATQRKESNP